MDEVEASGHLIGILNSECFQLIFREQIIRSEGIFKGFVICNIELAVYFEIRYNIIMVDILSGFISRIALFRFLNSLVIKGCELRKVELFKLVLDEVFYRIVLTDINELFIKVAFKPAIDKVYAYLNRDVFLFKFSVAKSDACKVGIVAGSAKFSLAVLINELFCPVNGILRSDFFVIYYFIPLRRRVKAVYKILRDRIAVLIPVHHNRHRYAVVVVVKDVSDESILFRVLGAVTDAAVCSEVIYSADRARLNRHSFVICR